MKTGLATKHQFIIVSKDLHYIKISKLCTKLAVRGKKKVVWHKLYDC